MISLPALALFLLASAQAPDPEIAVISTWLPGRYDTFAQAAADEARGSTYRHVRAVLAITPVAVDALPPGAAAFYLEQAMAGSEATPCRQRVIVLRRVNGAIINELYRVKNPSTLVGNAPSTLALSSLMREAGCDASWELAPDSTFRGIAGNDGHCPSTLNGATHAVSVFALTRETFTTLDRGLDDAGIGRWGPPAGEVGHVFVKRRP